MIGTIREQRCTLLFAKQQLRVYPLTGVAVVFRAKRAEFAS